MIHDIIWERREEGDRMKQRDDDRFIADGENLKCEEQLERYKYFFQNSMEALIITDDSLNILEINKQASELLQMIDNTCIGFSLRDVLHQVSDSVWEHQIEIVKKDGSLKDEWLFVNALNNCHHIEFYALYNGVNYFFTLKDITSYKKNQEDYSISTKMFKEVFTQVSDGFLILDINARIVDVNGAFLNRLGLPKEEFIGKELKQFIKSTAIPKWLRDWDLLVDSGKINSTIEIEIEGRGFYFEYNTYKNVYNSQFLSVFKDMTEKKLIELQLKQSKEVFSYVFDQAIDAIILTDRTGVVIRANDVASRTFEMDKEDLIGIKLEGFVTKKDKKYYHMIAQFLQTGAVREELFFLMPNGQRKLLEFTSKRVEDTSVNITIFRNVSERHEMEVKLRKSEKRFRKIFDGMSDGLILWRNDQIVDINESGTKIIEYPKERIISMRFQELMDIVPENRKGLERMLQRISKQNNVEEIIPFKFWNGRTKYLEFSTKNNLVAGLNLTTFKDVTEKLELQEQLRKSDTLTVVGELAAGIAHEIRNPMTALKGFIQLLQSSVTEDFSSYFSIITSELKRIDAIITEFLVLAKPQAIQYKEKDINDILRETTGLLSAESILYNVLFTANFSKENLLLYCEPNQLKQVFINIIKNALEAMKDGGNITISTELYNEDYIKVQIEDEGYGIPEDKLRKLGEPFYTTKERGTGLGLMVSFKIIEEHNGRIEVESFVGKGTIFSIYLPCYSDLNVKD